MISREKEVLLGAVVFVAIVIVVIGAVWLSENYAGAAGGYQLHVRFDSVPGLQKGSKVYIRGVEAGKVLKIQLVDGLPIVTMGFAYLHELPKDSRLLVKSEGLLGGQMIEVQMGIDRNRVYADNDTVQGMSGGGIERLTKQAASMAEHLESAMDRALGDQNLSHLEGWLANMDSTAGHLRLLLYENRETLSTVLDTLALASGETQKMLGENRPEIRQTIENLRRSTERLERMLQNMELASESLKKTLVDFNEISATLRRGEGTLGKLIYDDRVYMNLQHTLTSVDSLIEAIKKDPTRYFNVKFKLF